MRQTREHRFGPSLAFWRQALCGLGLCCLAAGAGAQQDRPAITGISHLCVYASDPQASSRFYAHDLGATQGPDLQDPQGTRYYFNATQFVEVLPLPAGQGISRMACAAFNTTDAAALRGYLLAHGMPQAGALHSASNGSRWFAVKDPEGNRVEFDQPGLPPAIPKDARPIGAHIIHLGYLVHSRAAEDSFYRELLGFRPYWYGGKNPGSIDWVSQQVPNGRDWLEYMLVGDGSDVQLAQIDARALGVLNHFSIGVANMEQAVTTLIREDRMSPRHDGPSMGLDGKWQANLYDPDGTRIELMEFQPVAKPCCSAFTAESPAN